MLMGYPPFYHANTDLMYKMIITKEINYLSIVKPEVKDLISKLLNKNPHLRMGSLKDSEEILSHPWFEKIKLEDIYNRKVN